MVGKLRSHMPSRPKNNNNNNNNNNKLAKMVRKNISKLWKLTKGLRKPKEHFFKKNS